MSRSGHYAIPLTLASAAVILLYSVREILLPFALAGGMAFLLNPLVKFFEVRGLRRGPVVVLVYLAVMAVFSAGLYKGLREAAAEADRAAQQMPLYVARGAKLVESMRAAAARPHDPHRERLTVERIPLLRSVVLNSTLLDSIARHGSTWPQQILGRMPSVAVGIIPILELALLVPFIGFFFMLQGVRLRDSVLGWVPSHYVEMVLNLLVEFDNSLGRYLRGICLEAACVGLLAYAGFRFIGLEYALQIAVVAGVANLVPYMGPMMSGLIASGVAIFQTGDLITVLQVWAVCGALRLADDLIIQPTVLRNAVHLHPVLIVFSLMAGAQLAGFWGLLLGVPAACVTKAALGVLLPWYRAQFGWESPPPHPEVNRIPLI